MKQLYKEGKRKCCYCKAIFPLNADYFHRARNKKGGRGFVAYCKPCALKKRREDRYGDPKYTYAIYKYGARKRGLSFTISFAQFQKLWGNDCYYCGDKIEFIGIDRKDNKQGYTTKNIVACCFPCNQMKGSKFSEQEFIKKCAQIAKNFS